MSIEEKLVTALRGKVRFDSPKGPRTVEDLFSISTSALNAMYEELADTSASQPARSLMASSARSAEAILAELKMDIIEYVYNLKTAEAKAATDKANARKSLQTLLQEQEDRKSGKLKTLPDADLEASIASLKAILDS